MIPFEEALELCIEAVHQGAPVEDCLARYPEYAPRLAPLLGVARELYVAPLEVMSETGFERQRARLHVQLQARQAGATNSHAAPSLNGASPNGVHLNGAHPNGAHPNGKLNGKASPAGTPPTTHYPPSPRRSRWAGRLDWSAWARLTTQRAALMTVVAVLAVVASLGGVTLASAKAAPDEPLYSVKRVVETVVDWLPAPAETQASRALDRAEERLAESRAVCLSNPMRAEELQQQMAQQRERALRLVEGLTGPTAEAIRQRAEDMQTRSAAVTRECLALTSPASNEAPTSAGGETAPVVVPPLEATATGSATPTPLNPLGASGPAPASTLQAVSNSGMAAVPPTSTVTLAGSASAARPTTAGARAPATSAAPTSDETPSATPVPATATAAPVTATSAAGEATLTSVTVTNISATATPVPASVTTASATVTTSPATATLAPATATALPTTATPVPSATPIPLPSPVPATSTPLPPATSTPLPTLAPTVRPTWTINWTPVVEPSRTPFPTDEPRPTEPPPTELPPTALPPTLSPATPVPSAPPPPTPTMRVLEVTKVPTQAPPPTSRPLEATATARPADPTAPPRPAPTETPSNGPARPTATPGR